MAGGNSAKAGSKAGSKAKVPKAAVSHVARLEEAAKKAGVCVAPVVEDIAKEPVNPTLTCPILPLCVL